uniref:Uncharacterized protein n=1 Tax=Gracilaria firma TaxID=2510791 RepID=A0A1P8D6K8_9FLOR|nr:hypothetical protein [Gracilaria firma]APR74442.1 hypothetical protein [Gracilaria firma]
MIIIYLFCDNWLSFDALSSKKLTSINIQVSLPLIRMFDANNYYALINWQVFKSLPTTKLRLLYFYFCVNVKVSSHYTEFTVNYLVKNLYSNYTFFQIQEFFLEKLERCFHFF